jgi:division protein CdvB (Snf7/Vps24/ESCRT-III family)
MESSILVKLKFKIQQNTKYKIQNTKYKIQNTKYKIQNTKYKIQNTKYKIQNTHSDELAETYNVTLI